MNRVAARDGRIAVRAVDLTRPLPTLDDVRQYANVRVYVTARGALLGRIDVDNHHERVGASRLCDAVADAATAKLLDSMLRRQLAGGEPPTASADLTASIVAVTRDRPDDLRTCLRCLVGQVSGRRVEVIVVDSAPASGSTRAVVAEFPGVLLIHAERRGHAHALNKGFLASTGDLVVTTDDDVTMADDWLETLLAPFVDPAVMAVTGTVLPVELETRAQRLFDAHAQTSGRLQRRDVDRAWFGQFVSAVPTWELGGTTNAAFRSSIFRHPAIGLTDDALGPGTPTGSGDDVHLFYKIVAAGGRLVHEPAAHVWRRHPRDMGDLRRAIYRYGKGHVAFQLTTLIRHGDRRSLVRLLLTLPRAHARRAADRLRGRTEYPLSLIVTEVAGNLAGPCAVWRSWHLDERNGSSAAGTRRVDR